MVSPSLQKPSSSSSAADTDQKCTAERHQRGCRSVATSVVYCDHMLDSVVARNHLTTPHTFSEHDVILTLVNGHFGKGRQEKRIVGKREA